MVSDDPMANGKPQPGSLTRRLGREEGIEDLGKNLWRDTTTVIAYLDLDFGAFPARLHHDPSRARLRRLDRIDAVNQKIEKYLIELRDSRADLRQLSESTLDLDVQPAQRLPEHHQALVD